jgi:hypothetical protein
VLTFHNVREPENLYPLNKPDPPCTETKESTVLSVLRLTSQSRANTSMAIQAMLASLSPLGVAFSSTASQPQRRKFLKLSCKSNSKDNEQVCFSLLFFILPLSLKWSSVLHSYSAVVLLTKFHLGEFYLSKLINFQSFQRSPKASYRILANHHLIYLQRLYIFFKFSWWEIIYHTYTDWFDHFCTILRQDYLIDAPVSVGDGFSFSGGASPLFCFKYIIVIIPEFKL